MLPNVAVMVTVYCPAATAPCGVVLEPPPPHPAISPNVNAAAAIPQRTFCFRADSSPASSRHAKHASESRQLSGRRNCGNCGLNPTTSPPDNGDSVPVSITERLAINGAGHGDTKQPTVALAHVVVSDPETPPTDCTGNMNESVPEDTVMVGLMAITKFDEPVIVNVCGADAPAVGAGLLTVTLTGPGWLSCDPGMVIVSEPSSPSTAPVSALPPKFTTAPVRKLLPVSTSVTGCPAVPVVGAMELSVGVGLLLVSAKFANRFVACTLAVTV